MWRTRTLDGKIISSTAWQTPTAGEKRRWFPVSYGRGAHPGSTEDGEGAGGSEEQQLKQQVDAEIERYNALYVRADEVCCIENGFAEEEKNKNGRGECELMCCIRLAFSFCWR